MPFALAIIGLFLIVAGARGMGNIRALRDLLVKDFTGQNNFLAWIFAIGMIGMIGYIPQLQKISRAFLVLLFVVMLLVTKGGFLSRIQQAFKNAGGSVPSISGATDAVAGRVGTAITGTVNGLTGTGTATGGLSGSFTDAAAGAFNGLTGSGSR